MGYEIEPSRWKMAVSNALRKSRDFSDNVQFKFDPPGDAEYSMGLGELLFGEGPEVMEDWAYGLKPWSGRGQTWQLDPRMIDVAGTPTLGAAAGTKLAANALRKSVTPTPTKEAVPDLITIIREEMAEDAAAEAAEAAKPNGTTRRDFLKGAGAAAVTAGTAGSLAADLLRKSAPEAALKTAVRVPSMGKVNQALDSLTGTSLADMRQMIDSWKSVWKEHPRYQKQYEEALQVEEAFNNLPDDFKVSDIYNEGMKEELAELFDELPPDVTPEEALKRLLGHPEMNMPDYGELGSKARWMVDPDNPSMSVNPRYAPDADLAKKTDEAYKSLWDLDEKDIDLWIATGRPPKDYPEELIPYMDIDVLLEKGGRVSGWDDSSGMFYGPEGQIENYLNDLIKRGE